jgi:hypothetical protein
MASQDVAFVLYKKKRHDVIDGPAITVRHYSQAHRRPASCRNAILLR